MATGYTREWIQFFTGCGIPDDVATMYALIFYENRIQKNMLLDLNKEYLRDMGITVMGDVIAILRYAKTVHEKYIREQILSVDDSNQLQQKNISSPLVKKSTPMKRMLEHYTRKYNSNETDTVSEVQVVLPNDEAQKQKVGMLPPLNKKIEITMKTSNFKEKGLEVPVPKVRRVLPENEGGYKIKMPSGTTERSKKLLEQAKKRKIKTVFDRLGESSVSSTTSEISTATSSSSSASFAKNSSVFSRLGEKTSAVSSTSSNDDFESLAPDHLPYAGILKGGGSKKGLPNGRFEATMRADIELKSDIKSHTKKKISVKKRLGTTNPISEDEGVKQGRANDLRKGLIRKPGINFKTSNKNGVNTEDKNRRTGALGKSLDNLRVESVNSVSTTTQVSTTEVRNLKRKLDSNSSTDPSPSKKVRFGKTTHRLIPSTTGSSEPVNYVKNYPKLTMIISNRAGNEKLPGGSLSSDKVKQKLNLKDRIGKQPVHGRLGKRIGGPVSGPPPSKKAARIQDRLG